MFGFIIATRILYNIVLIKTKKHIKKSTIQSVTLWKIVRHIIEKRYKAILQITRKQQEDKS